MEVTINSKVQNKCIVLGPRMNCRTRLVICTSCAGCCCKVQCFGNTKISPIIFFIIDFFFNTQLNRQKDLGLRKRKKKKFILAFVAFSKNSWKMYYFLDSRQCSASSVCHDVVKAPRA